MHILTLKVDEKIDSFEVSSGSNLREVLVKLGYSPYTSLTRRFNCGGRGLCATCGVWLEDHIEPSHWHDRVAYLFGYPRLSCQITIHQDTTIRLVTDKWIWGRRDARIAKSFQSDS